jgi:predicted HTH transcriptional regulator
LQICGGIIFFGIKDKTFEIIGMPENIEIRKEFNDI